MNAKRGEQLASSLGVGYSKPILLMMIRMIEPRSVAQSYLPGGARSTEITFIGDSVAESKLPLQPDGPPPFPAFKPSEHLMELERELRKLQLQLSLKSSLST
jgi:hypothetical protein